ncbi:MAG: lipopolysaccharide heptosyltransferase II [Candidatus Omnitrophica bacterium]|nr:lipopolysaccharide heptosyltransferase II [Candidatus Omnitrophota bacterium]MDD5660741.1 lipopolysaccharide heptosyltransferase II [Candidatus Omnitrophota bacterium]
MKILQVVPELNVGGVETGTVDLAKYLVRLGHKSVVVSAGGSLVKDLESAGSKHYMLAVNKKSIISMFKLVPVLAKIIKDEEIDIVHARSRVPAWIAYFACRSTSAVFITTCHGYYKKHIFSSPMGWAKRVIVLSNVIARHMIEDFAVPHDRIRLVPRSVDLERFKYLCPKEKRKETFNVGIIGRITPLKGHLHFIKAMARVSRAVPRLKIWIVGDAPLSKEAYKEELQVLVRRLGIWHCTEFLGTQRDIPGILAHLDLVVLATTTHEAFGRVIVEAQAAGVPVVATKVGGVIDIIEDGKNGLLVPPADHKSMADAILRIFNDLQLAQELAQHAYAKVKEKYNVELMVKNTLDVYRDALSNFKVLVIKLSSLGDIILSTAALRAIREKFMRNNFKISFLIGEEYKDILLRSPYIDELLVCELKNKDKGLAGLWSIGNILRKKNFDIVIDLQNNRASHILSYLSGSINRYGYDNKKFSFLLNHVIKDEKPLVDPVTHQFRILKMLGIDLLDNRLELWPFAEDIKAVDELLNAQWLSQIQKIVGINISASKRWSTKTWPLEYLISLCEELGLKDIRVVITGTEEDVPFANILVNSLKNTKIINACGKTSINELAVLIKKCNVFISADSSPLHIASAVGTPFIALFGPTDHRRHLPPGKNHIVINKDLNCSPCYKTKCRSKRCMEQISPAEVLAAVEKMLK